LDLETIRTNLKQAEERLEEAREAYEAARREVFWWQQGLKIFDRRSAQESEGARNNREPAPEDEAARYVRHFLPEGFGTRKPTLRQAIMMILRANTRSPWSVADIAFMLKLNGWLPEGDATKRISDLASVMVTEGHLRRVGRGTYQPSTLLALALERWLPPISDYRNAAAEGLPVADHPTASEGLSDG
jgi:hypothetical protein